MPKKDRTAIYEYLFKEGVMVAEKNFYPANHPKLAVPNLHVIKALQSLTSRGYVTERFAWQHYYWYLTNSGIEYLREYLHLPQEIVPATLKKPTKPMDARSKKSRTLFSFVFYFFYLKLLKLKRYTNSRRRTGQDRGAVGQRPVSSRARGRRRQEGRGRRWIIRIRECLAFFPRGDLH